MAEDRIISADSHFVEPPNMWAERIDQKFRDRAPHTVQGFNGREGEFFADEKLALSAIEALHRMGSAVAELLVDPLGPHVGRLYKVGICRNDAILCHNSPSLFGVALTRETSKKS